MTFIDTNNGSLRFESQAQVVNPPRIETWFWIRESASVTPTAAAFHKAFAQLGHLAELAAARSKQRQGSYSDEWITPEAVYRELEAFFGPWDLDPCVPSDCGQWPWLLGPKTVYALPDSDGLASDPWPGRTIFLNPPYSQVELWMARAMLELARGGRRFLVALLPASVDRGWFEVLGRVATSIAASRGRIRFIDPAQGRTAPRAGSLLLCFHGPDLGLAIDPNETKEGALS